MQLANAVREYYFAHLDQLPAHKQFHFCTRLAAWEGEARALAGLARLRPSFVPQPLTQQALADSLQRLIAQGPAMPTNAAGLRDPYFERFPELKGVYLALFRVRHLLAVYGVDARETLLALFPEHVLQSLKWRLLEDSSAMRVLSTYAVNYIYLLERVMLEHTDRQAIDVAALSRLGDSYDLTDPRQLQLFAYLYTHCIIAESNYYTKRLPDSLLPQYKKMLARLDDALAQHFSAVNLDNKLEFLVACRIAGFRSSLEDRIYRECRASVHPDGAFLVDRHNSSGQHDRTNLPESEHRNVLFIMSTAPYSPQPTLIETSE